MATAADHSEHALAQAALLHIVRRAPALLLRTARVAWAVLLGIAYRAWAVLLGLAGAFVLARVLDRLPALVLVLMSPDAPRLL